MSQSPEHPHRPIRSLYADDPEMADLVETFVGEMPARLDALRAAWMEGHVQSLQRLAHQLKGSSGGYGFPSVSRAAGELEERLRTIEDAASGQLDDISREFELLLEMCARTCSASVR